MTAEQNAAYEACQAIFARHDAWKSEKRAAWVVSSPAVPAADALILTRFFGQRVCPIDGTDGWDGSGTGYTVRGVHLIPPASGRTAWTVGTCRTPDAPLDPDAWTTLTAPTLIAACELVEFALAVRAAR